MDKNTILAIIVLGIIAAFSVAIFSDLAKNPNEETISGIKFISDSKNPSAHLKELSLKNTFAVSPEFTKDPSALNSKMADVITRFSTVFAYLGKNSIVIARTFDSNALVSCYTNEGSYLGGKEITKEECEYALSQEGQVAIYVSTPANKSLVSVSGNTITITPSTETEISTLPHLVLRIMFGNKADEAINASNIKSDELKK